MNNDIETNSEIGINDSTVEIPRSTGGKVHKDGIPCISHIIVCVSFRPQTGQETDPTGG
jgi:hypothetical protein